MKAHQYQNTLNEINGLIVGEKIRVTSQVAKALMLNNPKIVIGHTRYGLIIRNLGLGVCSVELNTILETKLGK